MKKILLAVVFSASISAIDLSGQCANSFYEGFESGAYTPTWSVGTAPITWTVATASPAPAQGTYCLNGNGGNSTHLQGLVATVPASTPTSASWYMYPNGTSAGNYVLLGDNTMAASNCISFCYYNGTQVRFVSSSTFNYTPTLNQWLFVEMRNIDYVARTFDIYLNGVLQQTGFPFRTSTQNTITRIHLYNFTSGAFGAWDDITLGSTPVTAFTAVTPVTCNGGSDGASDLTVSSGISPYTFAWSNGATTEDITGVTAGTYSVVVTAANGCLDTVYATIAEPTAITSTTMQTNILCNGGNNGDAMVMASGGTPGYTYLWSSGGTAATESNLTAGMYTCTITDANGCTSQQTVNITEPALLSGVATSSGNICIGGSATLNAIAMGGTPNHTFNWLPGNLPGAMQTVSPASTETYTVEITDANGCTTSATTTVVVNLPPVVNLGPDTTVCGGIILDAQNSGSTYLWNDNSTQQLLGVTSTGVYSVTVTDINGCSASDTVSVNVDAPSNGGIISCSGGVDVCPGDSINLSSAGETGVLNWWVWLGAAPFWQNVGSGNPFDPGPPALADTGTYQFMAIASNGVCPDDTSNIITVIVQVPPVPAISDTAACGSSLVLDAGVSGATYLWSDNSTQQQLAVNASGMYSVTVTDQFGCVGSDTANVILNPNPVVTGSASNSTPCLDDANVVLTGTPGPGTWSGPGVTGNSFDPSVGTGPQILTYVFTDSNGCSGQYIHTVNVNACVGISEGSNSVFSVYPNPNNGMFSLAMNNSAEKLAIEITDMQGRIVYATALNGVQAGNVIPVDVTNVATGNYIMRVTADGSVSNHQIIIAK